MPAFDTSTYTAVRTHIIRYLATCHGYRLSDAEDFAQEALLKAWQLSEAGQPVENLDSFACRAALNRARDDWRRLAQGRNVFRKAFVWDQIYAKSVTPESEVLENEDTELERQNLLRRLGCLEALRPEFHQMLTLRLAGHKYKQLAAILKVTQRTIDRRMAMVKLYLFDGGPLPGAPKIFGAEMRRESSGEQHVHL